MIFIQLSLQVFLVLFVQRPVVFSESDLIVLVDLLVGRREEVYLRGFSAGYSASRQALLLIFVRVICFALVNDSIEDIRFTFDLSVFVVAVEVLLNRSALVLLAINGGYRGEQGVRDFQICAV